MATTCAISKGTGFSLALSGLVASYATHATLHVTIDVDRAMEQFSWLGHASIENCVMFVRYEPFRLNSFALFAPIYSTWFTKAWNVSIQHSNDNRIKEQPDTIDRAVLRCRVAAMLRDGMCCVLKTASQDSLFIEKETLSNGRTGFILNTWQFFDQFNEQTRKASEHLTALKTEKKHKVDELRGAIEEAKQLVVDLTADYKEAVKELNVVAAEASKQIAYELWTERLEDEKQWDAFWSKYSTSMDDSTMANKDAKIATIYSIYHRLTAAEVKTVVRFALDNGMVARGEWFERVDEKLSQHKELMQGLRTLQVPHLETGWSTSDEGWHATVGLCRESRRHNEQGRLVERIRRSSKAARTAPCECGQGQGYCDHFVLPAEKWLELASVL